MKVKMKKYLFAGTKVNHDRFFEKAQKLGLMQFISVMGKKPHLFPKDVEKAKNALKILSKHAKPKQEKDSPGLIADIFEEVLSNREMLDAALEKKRMLNIEMIRVKPFGSFSIEDLHAIEENSNKVIQFFMMRHDRIPASEVPESLLHIDRVDNIDYFLYVGEEKLQNEAITEVHVERAYNAVFLEYEELLADIKEMESREISACCYVKLIEDYIFARMNSINLNFAKDDVDYLVENKLFVIDAWIPETKVKQIETLLENFSMIAEEVAIDKDDKPPTYLVNKGFSKMGEDLVYVYDTPSVTDKDPSNWVLGFFALFFGMIISDAGYGFIFLAVALFCWKKFGRELKGIKKRMLKILTLLSCSTIIWGVLVASYFSIPMKPGDFLNKISIPYNLAIEKLEYHKNGKTKLYKEWVREYPAIANVIDPQEMLTNGTKQKGNRVVFELMSDLYDSIFLELSLLIGIIHLCISFVRNFYRSWSGIGWIMTLIGGYLYFPKMLEGSSMLVYTGLIDKNLSFIIGEQMLYIGLGGAVLLAIIQERSISGLAALFKAIEVFSDSLSYLRLYALGLASMVLAGTFNEIGPDIGGPMFGWIIILLGHTVNITLGVMAGVIHGLRLNFLEWYHHCYEGGGIKFNPLRLLKSE